MAISAPIVAPVAAAECLHDPEFTSSCCADAPPRYERFRDLTLDRLIGEHLRARHNARERARIAFEAAETLARTESRLRAHLGLVEGAPLPLGEWASERTR